MSKPGVKPIVKTRAALLAAMLENGGIEFEYDGQLFSIRQPTTEEYDDALMIEETVRQDVLTSGLLADLKDKPGAQSSALADMLEAEAEAETSPPKKRQLLDRAERLRRNDSAQEIANLRAHLARDRWLVARLLCDADGNQLIDPETTAGAAAWERLPMGLKDAARPAVWEVLEAVHTLPFDWALLRKSSIDSPSDTDNGPLPPESSD